MFYSGCTLCYHVQSLIKVYVIIFYILFPDGLFFNAQNAYLVTA